MKYEMEIEKEPSIKYVRNFFRKTNISHMYVSVSGGWKRYFFRKFCVQKEKVHIDCEKSAQISVFTKQACNTMMTQYYH